MTVAVFVTSESDAAYLIPWGVHFAQADHTDLLIVCPRKSKGKRGWDALELSEKNDNSLYQAVFDVLEQQDPERVVLKQAIAEGTESTNLDRVAIETRELIAPAPESAFVEEVAELGVRTLLLPAHEPIKGALEDQRQWSQRLLAEAPCQVVIVKGSPPACNSPIQVLVASQNDISSDEQLSLALACQLSTISNTESVTLLYVRPDDDEVATQIAQKHLKQLVKTVSEKNVVIETKVELADSFCEGINRLPLDEFDLVIVGTRHPKLIRSLFRDLGPKDDVATFAIATVREAVPMTDRMWSGFKTAVRSKVPQLERESRVSLVDRLQNNSQFDFDFVALISLSTLIAALGLARNSGAVVIGAMLVAPLMTPLVAMGFALVQGNEKLIRSALKSVSLGFTVALIIGAIVGLTLRVVAPHFAISPQMLDRGSPNVLDLVVALASGVAGAYAMGRPNLISAIPGVAIAAALVPPIATSGLALMMGDLKLSGGASLLFFTNIVAIVLGTAITFWAVGISTRVTGDRQAQLWPRVWFLGFVIISFALAIGMSILNPLDHAPTDTPTGSNVQAFTEIN